VKILKKAMGAANRDPGNPSQRRRTSHNLLVKQHIIVINVHHGTLFAETTKGGLHRAQGHDEKNVLRNGYVRAKLRAKTIKKKKKKKACSLQNFSAAAYSWQCQFSLHQPTLW
jgi:hemin uptake protein HemP